MDTPTFPTPIAPEAIAARKANIAEQIAERGYAFICSNDSTDTPAFVYTIGLCLQNRPEIFLSGNMSELTAMGLIDRLVKRWKKEGRVVTGRLGRFISVGDVNMAIKAERIERDRLPRIEQRFTTFVKESLPEGKQYDLVQLFWPDTKGNLPENRGYDSDPQYKQEMLNRF